MAKYRLIKETLPSGMVRFSTEQWSDYTKSWTYVGGTVTSLEDVARAHFQNVLANDHPKKEVLEERESE